MRRSNKKCVSLESEGWEEADEMMEGGMECQVIRGKKVGIYNSVGGVVSGCGRRTWKVTQAFIGCWGQNVNSKPLYTLGAHPPVSCIRKLCCLRADARMC